jgi:hypothetical protein
MRKQFFKTLARRQKMLSTEKTILDPQNRPWYSRRIVIILVATCALLFIFLLIASSNNSALQIRVENAERLSDERAAEIKRLTELCGNGSAGSVEKPSAQKEGDAKSEAAAEGDEEKYKVEKW